ncbi:MAG: hypothetical protein C0452_20740 [Pseudomonas sp.]|uniref:hypothetical protein n=1 Tax=Ectopseudomonas hydrolytica TaxID=2493633 RepID=UPI0010FBC98E|nr:hypothetical protein [Pseudomonas sp.]ARS49274.1 hypothetical protein PSMEN_13070 [Pseudomonas mendocina]MBA4246355.1 hypothetical protein [Pseudomonas sp.]
MKLAVAIIHGIGKQPDSRDLEGQHLFAQSLILGLRQRLGDDAKQVAFQTLYWASVLDKREEAFLARLAHEPVTWRWLRRAVTLFLGDAAGYRKVSEAYDTTYQEVHQCVRNGLSALRAQVDPQTPLLVVAHSLGGHIFSNYAWDQQKLNATPSCPLDPFLALETLAGIITFGCNIPLFTFAYDPVQPIRFPGHCLTEPMRQQARWLNLYAPADPLGYPLRPVPGYTELVHEDRAMAVGPWYLRHTPLSHLAYWHDPRFHHYVAQEIRRLLSAQTAEET